MAIPITDHPGYGAAMATYQQAKQAAAESGDAAQQQKAEYDWSQTVNKLQNEMFDRQQAEQARSAAVAQAKALVPDIPDAVLANLLTPEQIMQAATALKEQADARTPATPPADQKPAPNPQAWGASPPTGPAPSPAPDANDPKVFHDRMTGMADEIKKNAGRNPELVEQFDKEYFDSFILPGMIKQR